MREAIPDTATLRDAVAAIETTRKLICAVVAADGKLLGVLSDGDIRRALLQGAGLDAPVVSAMTRTPIVGPADATPAEVHAIMAERGVAAIPLSAFYEDGREQGLVRLCFAKRDETLDEALARLARL